ncbi:MAG: Ppx/GppA family phosphatase, partial [Kiritimatiellae bacterium]|nr:Ppx/GppA family phosphatase [Kiritimatiellia bacterium]
GRTVAVVELGTTSVRMVVAQAKGSDEFEVLTSLQQPVTLGRDTFTKGTIDLETTERCVEALRQFQNVMKEYGIRGTSGVRAVATSAVREARNRQMFLDRILVATGMDVEILDEPEVSRFTYLGVLPTIMADHALRHGEVLILEVGGGSTEALYIRDGKVVHSHIFRLGSLRLREIMGDYSAPPGRQRAHLKTHVDLGVRQILDTIPLAKETSLLALGGDARLAAAILGAGLPAGPGSAKITVTALGNLTDEILGLSVDEVVRRYHASYPDAETFGPALLCYHSLARALKLRSINVGGATLRDGILREELTRSWSDDFVKQIISSAVEVGRKYNFDRRHAENVVAVARFLFEHLRHEHGLDKHDELLLVVAAYLHDIGMFVSTRSHHKHSMYLILNSDIFGLGARDLLLTALVARYHRRAAPDPAHEFYGSLDRTGRVTVAKLASILRIADALDRRHGSAPYRLRLSFQPGRLVIGVEGCTDVGLEQFALMEKGPLFKQVYGMDVMLRPIPGES